MLPWDARSVVDTFHTLHDHKTDQYGQTVEHPTICEQEIVNCSKSACDQQILYSINFHIHFVTSCFLISVVFRGFAIYRTFYFQKILPPFGRQKDPKKIRRFAAIYIRKILKLYIFTLNNSNKLSWRPLARRRRKFWGLARSLLISSLICAYKIFEFLLKIN